MNSTKLPGHTIYNICGRSIMYNIGPLTWRWEPDAAWVFYYWMNDNHVIFQFGKLLVKWEFVIK